MPTSHHDKHSSWLRRLAILWAFGGLWWYAGVVHAQARTPGQLEAPSAEPERRHLVYVMPRLSFFPDPEQSRENTPQLDTLALREAVESYFASDPERFRVMEAEALFRRFDSPTGVGQEGVSSLRFFLNVQNAQTNLQGGIKALSRFDLQDAERLLKEAARLYEEVRAPLLLPDELARVYEYLGLVYVEQGEHEEEAIESFVKMIRLDSRRVLIYPFYHQSTEDLYQKARARLLASRGGGADTKDRNEMRLIARLVGANIVIWGYAVQQGAEVKLHLQMFRRDGESAGFPTAESIVLPMKTADAAERANRLASRFAACVEPLPTPLPLPPERERGRFYLASAFSYTRFLQPSDTPFNNYGFALTGNAMMSDNFALVGKFTILDGGNDSDESLIKSPLSVRLFGGAGFSLKPLSWLRLHTNFMLEGTFVSEIQRTNDFFCKVDRGSSKCNEDNILSQAPAWYAGIHAEIGASLKIYKELYAYGAGGFSFYALPLEEREVNYPINGDIGLEYRF